MIILKIGNILKELKQTKINSPFPAVSIENFIPSASLVRAAAASFETMPQDNWVKYNNENSNQVQYCSKNRLETTPAAILVMDYIATHFNPDNVFKELNTQTFPDLSFYGGGMMLTPNCNGEGGHLGMHVDAEVHGKNLNWRREYSAVLCISEEYDSSFDLLLHDGVKTHARLPYKFNTLNVFKCSNNSWHGLPEITKGFSRKTLGVMYWSKIKNHSNDLRTKAKFKYDLEFK